MLRAIPRRIELVHMTEVQISCNLPISGSVPANGYSSHTKATCILDLYRMERNATQRNATVYHSHIVMSHNVLFKLYPVLMA